MKRLTLTLSALLISVVIFAQSAAEYMAQGAALEKQMNESAALFKYKKALQLEPNNFDALVKASWLSARVGYRVADVNKKREYFEQGMEYAKKALSINENDAEAHYVMSISYGRMAQISSAKERVAMLTDIQNHGKKTVQLNPSHAGGYYVLGRLNLRVANLSTAEKAAANIIFGGVPKGMSNEKAIAFFKKAISLRPDYILYWTDLATAYAKVNEYDKAKAACQKALSLPVLTEDDPGYKLRCKSMLNKLQ